MGIHITRGLTRGLYPLASRFRDPRPFLPPCLGGVSFSSFLHNRVLYVVLSARYTNLYLRVEFLRLQGP